MSTSSKAIIVIIFCLIAVKASFSQKLSPKPVPDVAAPAMATPEAAVTEIPFEANIPVPDLNPLVKDVCDFLKDSEQGFNYEIWLKSPLPTPELKKDTLSLNTHAYFWLDNGSVGCGWDDEPSQERVIKIETKFKWGKAWNLEAITTVKPFECPYSNPDDLRCNCRISIASFNVTKLVDNIGRKSLQNVIDSTIAKYKSKIPDARPIIAEAWKASFQPVEVPGVGWFMLQPRAMKAGKIEANDTAPRQIKISFVLKAQPTLVMGPKPTPTTTELPELETEPDPLGFHLRTDLAISYDQINKLLQQPTIDIVGKPTTSPFGSYRIVGAKLYPSKNKVALKLLIEGNSIKKVTVPVLVPEQDEEKRQEEKQEQTPKSEPKPKPQTKIETKQVPFSGSLYFTMTPIYSARDKSIIFENVQLAPTTISSVTKSGAAWILTELLVSTIQSNLKISIGDKLEALNVSMNSYLNRSVGSSVEIKGGVDVPVVEKVFMSNRELKARVKLDGQATFNMK